MKLTKEAAAMAAKNKAKNSRRYQSKKLKQSEGRNNAIKKREKRLNKIGWSLFFFD